jgi:hypothetical protein
MRERAREIVGGTGREREGGKRGRERLKLSVRGRGEIERRVV